ncbi:hypothetical protein [Chryseobacterium daeguense]|uniref:hypothetical protein n=1 Tax=Chryseobacterium daeguense TaxID=412438 RepID=UPI0004052FEF|nr:hypothetical protein [Chryseobacterium daeguense]
MRTFNALIVLMLIFCFHNLKSQNIQTPENVFNLYFNSFVKYDDDSLKELNSYLINFLGKDNTHKMNLRDSSDERVDYFTNIFLSNLSADMAAACKVEAKNYFTVLVNNFKEAKYTIKSIEKHSDEKLKDQEFSEVVFEARFKVPSASDKNMGDLKKIGPGEMRKYLIDLTNHLKNADKVVSSEQKFNLYQMKDDRGTFYWNGGPQELAWKLNEFYFKNIN